MCESKCIECGTELKDIDLRKVVNGTIDVPFVCSHCGSIKFPFEPTRDVVFLLREPAPEVSKGGIYLIEETNFVGGGPRTYLRGNSARVLAIGPGFYNPKGGFIPTELQVGQIVHFNVKVPWHIDLKGDDGKEYHVVYCGEKDVWLKRDNEEKSQR